MTRGRPRQFPDKEYTYISFRKRKDDFYDVLHTKSKYDPEKGNWEKEIIRVGTPEADEFTRRARMRRWPEKNNKQTSQIVVKTAVVVKDE